MFLMMVPGEEGEERTTEEVVRKAEDMFNSLDIDGDGEVTEVKVLGKYNKSYIVFLPQDEFITGCLKDEDLVKQLDIRQ